MKTIELKQAEISREFFEAKIYALTDINDNIFYIGCTTNNLKGRLQHHLSAAKVYVIWGTSRKVIRIRDLNYKVKIKELLAFGLYAIDRKDMIKQSKLIEDYWIEKHIDMGIDLCNTIFIKGKCEREIKKSAKKCH